MKDQKRFGLMPFFRNLIIFLGILTFSLRANATDLMKTITSKQIGTCETNNLSFTAMKFYKIALNEKFENLDVFLRVLFFFNQERSVKIRLTTQALVSCQTTTNGEVACAYRSIEDAWSSSEYSLISNQLISMPEIGQVEFFNQEDTNRGFRLTFSKSFPLLLLQGKSFVGGMVRVNFNQEGTNTAQICSPINLHGRESF